MKNMKNIYHAKNIMILYTNKFKKLIFLIISHKMYKMNKKIQCMTT